LPKSLDETYKRILKEIKTTNREHAYRLLQCLTVATRPLRVEELAEVLAVDFHAGGIPRMNADWYWEDQEEAVLSACSSLVSVVIVLGSRVVQFSHFSVKEFLASDRLASCMEEVSQFYIPIKPSNVVLSQACLAVLLRLDDHTDEDTVKKIPLLPYAAQYWYRHAQIGNVELQIKHVVDHFFDMDKPHFSVWARIQGRDDLLRVSESENLGTMQPSAGPLYFAAECGLCGLVERLIVKHPQHINYFGGRYGTPLHASVHKGHIETARLLFAHGADINSRSRDNWTPLHIASKVGDLEIGQWLLNHGADVNSRTKDGRTPLHFSVDHEHVNFSRILLEFKAEVNVWDDNGLTPLLSAWGRGNLDILQLLLDHDADVHVRNKKRETLLHFASYHGHLELARMLLERNVEVNCQDYEGLAPIHRASESRSQDVLQLLLHHHADVYIRNKRGSTPLHRAVARDHLEACRLLLEHGADVNAWNHLGFTLSYASDFTWVLLEHNVKEEFHNKGMTPLHYAALCGHLEVAQLLLKHNAEVNAQGHNGLTPFLFASARQHTKVWELLLDHHADVHICDNKGRTPLHFVAHHGLLDPSRILILERNVEVNTRDDDGFTPLLRALECGNLDVFRLLLDHNADVHVRDNKGRTPLHFAAHHSHLEFAQELLGRNVVVNARDDKGFTPLLRALDSEHGKPDLLRLLLDNNADVHVRDNKGRNPLHFAAHYGHMEHAQILCKRNAEVNAQDDDELTPLLRAWERGNFDILRVFLDHNVDVHVRNNGETLLHFASHHGHLELAQILLERNVGVNSQDDEGLTPVHKAASKRRSFTVLQLLLDHNADVRICNNKGSTPLHLAVVYNRLEVCQTLLGRGANVNARNHRIYTKMANWNNSSLGMYIDDGLIFACAETWDDVTTLLRARYSTCADWLTKVGLAIEPEKTELMFFQKPYERNPMPPPSRLLLPDRDINSYFTVSPVENLCRLSLGLHSFLSYLTPIIALYVVIR
jgi:ankyrin repeat protein